MAHLEAAIFDMDGLMIDSEPVQMRAMNAALRPFGIQLAEDEWASMVGRRATENFAALRDKYEFEADLAELVRIKDEHYRELLHRHVVAMPGLYDAIEVCKSAGLRLALASSSFFEVIQVVLDMLRLAHTFEVVVSGDQVTHAKPDPEMFLLAARRLGVEPRRCLVLEDTAFGVAAAKAAGMWCIAVPNYFTAHNDFDSANLVLKSLSDLSLQVLEAL